MISSLKILKAIFVVAVSATLFSCAQQSSPTGGEKDTDSPKIKESFPLNFATNYNGSQLYFKFDEFIQINALSKQLVVTPSLKYQPEFKLKNKQLTVKILDTLATNTTYVFNFGNGIKDITENNPLDSNVFVFSTGNYIDSLSISGNIKNATTLEVEKDFIVGLFPNEEDTSIIKLKPIYISKSNERGDFKLSYLKPGEFKLLAFKDDNNDQLWNKESESIAFYSASISSTDTNHFSLYSYNEQVFTQYVKTYSSSSFGKLDIVLNEPASNPTIKLLDKSFKKAWNITEPSSNNDSITVWLTEQMDSLKLEISDTGFVIDTIELAMAPKPKEKRWNELRINAKTNAKGGSLQLYDSLKLTFSQPVNAIDGKVKLVENKDTIRVSLQSNDKGLRRYFVSRKWKEDAKYQLIIVPNQCVSIFGIPNDSIMPKFGTPTWNKYADLNLKIEVKESFSSQHILQLLDDKNQIVQENIISSSASVEYKHLLPKKYQLKLIYDTNVDGKWTEGDFIKNRQPEKVLFYLEPIEVRSGWDVDLSWEVISE